MWLDFLKPIVGLVAKYVFGFIKEKSKKEDSDFNNILSSLEKNVKAACNEYRINIRYPNENDLPESYDSYIYRHVRNTLKYDRPVILKDLPLPDGVR